MTNESGNDKVLKALNWQPKRRVTQADFDAAVRDNQDALGLEVDEAVESAVEEFEMQKADLSDVVMTPAGGDISSHAATQALEDLERAVTAHASSASVQDADDFAALFNCLSALLTTDDKADKQQNLAVALQSGALLRLLLMAQTEQLEDGSVVALLRLCTQCLQLLSIRDMFASKATGTLKTSGDTVKCHGPDVAVSILQQRPASWDVAEGVADMCTAAATGCEECKCKLVDSPYPRHVLRVVADGGAPLATQVALLASLKPLVTHDDDRPPASKAFMHARMLALDLDAVPVFVAVLRQAAERPDELAGVIAALQQLCASDEICKKVCDHNGVRIVLAAMEERASHAQTVAATCGLLRQLAKSDDVKKLVMRLHGLDVLQRALQTHKQSARVCTQALGLLATVMLRHPEHCEAAAAHEAAMAEVIDAMLAHRSSAAVMRQACQLVRNLVVRNTELRRPALDRGVEPLLRGAKKLPDCDDVATAALRDLGLADYNA